MAMQLEQPSSMVYVQASELFPKKTLASEDADQVPFPELCGESVEFLEKTSDATLALSNFRLFICFKDSFVNIPLRLIESLEMKDLILMDVNCKDARSYRILFDNSDQCVNWHNRLSKYICPVSRLEDLFAFAFYAWCMDYSGSTEKDEFTSFCVSDEVQYSFMCEVKRMGFDSDAWRITDINSNFELCPTYPKLHVVPAIITDKEMEAVAKFRTSRRFPSVVWRHMTNGAVIARCSQPEVGWLGWRSQEDERLLHALGIACARDSVSASLKKQLIKEMGLKDHHTNGHTDAIPNGDVVHDRSDDDNDGEGKDVAANDAVGQRKVLVVDARAYTAAVVNRAKGGGCECEEYYPGCEVLFMNLANIHSIRKSFHSLRMLCSGPRENPNWWSSVEKTQWLHHISLLLKATNTVVNAIHKEQRPVVVHCSDGWDRTTQIVALAELMLDPYYRTIEGFQVLVAREWLEFGHRFADRCGHGHNLDENQRCPVFLQWLDCVHQLTRQFPCSFEFNETFLVKLAHHVYSCLFGTFLCNSENERLKGNVPRRTFSVWSFLKLRRKELKNYLYSSLSEQILQASHEPRSLQLWSTVYTALPTPYAESFMESNDTSDYGDSVSSACITPVSPVFPNSMEQDERLMATTHISESKSDGSLVYKDCFENQEGLQNDSKEFGGVDKDVKSKSCHNCRTTLSQNLSESKSTTKDISDSESCDSKSIYFSATESCAAGVVSREDGVVSREDCVSEIESSMSSSTATVILEPNDEAISDNGENSLSEKLSAGETSEEVFSAGEINSADDMQPQESHESNCMIEDHSKCSANTSCDGDSKECKETGLPPSSSSSQSTLTSSVQETIPSTTTLRPSSSELFTRYLDVDGLTHIVDPVQDRLRQIEMAHQAKIESLQRKLLDTQTRQAAVGERGTCLSGQTSDLADEVCSLPESNVSGDQPPLSLSSADEGSWIQVDENEAQPTLWVPDHAATSCAKCDTQFWMANRKHHCRNCGLVFCGTCSEKRLPLPDEQLYDPVRVCYACFEKLVTLQERENGGRRHPEVAGS